MIAHTFLGTGVWRRRMKGICCDENLEPVES